VRFSCAASVLSTGAGVVLVLIASASAQCYLFTALEIMWRSNFARLMPISSKGPKGHLPGQRLWHKRGKQLSFFKSIRSTSVFSRPDLDTAADSSSLPTFRVDIHRIKQGQTRDFENGGYALPIAYKKTEAEDIGIEVV
jgi:hypothetical protein